MLPQGFPLPSFPAVPLEDIPVLFASALGISLVAIGDTISTSGGFARRAGYEIDGNQELAGIGSANLAAGLFSGLPREHERLADGGGSSSPGRRPS